MMKWLIGIMIAVAILALLYLAMIMPALRHKPQEKELRKWIYAHRGLHDNNTNAPENSMAAFRKAVEAGYGMELDVQLSKDKVPVVFHDMHLKRICGVEGRVCDYTFEELQQFRLCDTEEKIPAFSEVLEMVNGRTPLIVELKTETADVSVCPIADKFLERYKGLYCIESFNPFALHWYRTKRPKVVRGQLSDAFIKSGEYRGPSYLILQGLLLNFVSKPNFVAYNCRYPNTLSRKICHGLFHNMAVAWTVKSAEQLETLRGPFDLFIFEGFMPTQQNG